MTREEFLTAVSELVAGLQVPVSMNAPLGAALEPWEHLHRAVGGGFGWKVVGDYRRIFEQILGEGQILKAPEEAPEPTPLAQPRVQGKPFRCDCGSNVFYKLSGGRYRCNACGTEYEGT